VTFIQALLLGILQGITEFFPVSSSAHLKIAKFFFNLDTGESLVLFDLVSHLGSLLALVWFLRKQIYELLIRDLHLWILFAIAIIPLFFFYVFMKPIRIFFSDIHYTPFFLLLSALFLFITSYKKEKDFMKRESKIKDVLFIGSMQALALIPGISRSGSTISAACIRGWQLKEAVLFSFLLAIPTVVGGTVLEGYKNIALLKSANGLNIMHYLIGFISAFSIGLLSIRYLFSLTERRKLKPFAWYCLILSLVLITYFNII